jgi:hypothetical protein
MKLIVYFKLKHMNSKFREFDKFIEIHVKENPNYYKEIYDPIKSAEYRKNNIAILSEKQWIKRGIINISYVKYLKELKKQNGKCKICDNVLTKPQVDHDHKTGKYRALLCIPCNSGLGIYEINKEKFEMYLNGVINE